MAGLLPNYQLVSPSWCGHFEEVPKDCLQHGVLHDIQVGESSIFLCYHSAYRWLMPSMYLDLYIHPLGCKHLQLQVKHTDHPYEVNSYFTVLKARGQKL
jgi:hypothetical protein